MELRFFPPVAEKTIAFRRQSLFHRHQPIGFILRENDVSHLETLLESRDPSLQLIRQATLQTKR
jgi:hypothetical protein